MASGAIALTYLCYDNQNIIAHNAGRYTVTTPDVVARVQAIYGTKPRVIYETIILHLSNGGEPSAELLWRLARATHDLAAELNDPTAKKSLTCEGFEAAKSALKLDDDNFACHKWMAIMYSDIGDYEGTSKKLKDSPLMKKHFERAIELNPQDPTSRHLLGLWCFAFADLAWYLLLL